MLTIQVKQILTSCNMQFATLKMGTEPIWSGVFALTQMQTLQKLLSGNSLIDNNGTKWITLANVIAIAQWKQAIKHPFIVFLHTQIEWCHIDQFFCNSS